MSLFNPINRETMKILNHHLANPPSTQPPPPRDANTIEIERGRRFLERAASIEYDEQCIQAAMADKPTPPEIERHFTWQECIEASQANPPKKKRPLSYGVRALLEEADRSTPTGPTPPDLFNWVKTKAYIASSHEDDLITLQLESLLGVAIDRNVKYNDGITLVMYVPRKRIPWELRARVNRMSLSTAATIFWSPLLPKPEFGRSVDVWVWRTHQIETTHKQADQWAREQMKKQATPTLTVSFSKAESHGIESDKVPISQDLESEAATAADY